MTKNYVKTGGGFVAALAAILIWFIGGVIKGSTGQKRKS
jgi:hypothetical protein